VTVTSMPQPTLPAQRVEDPDEEVVLGVDTHKDVHVAAVIWLGEPAWHARR
jgi:hypothetical protein